MYLQNLPSINMDTPQMADPSFSQKRFPRMRTKTNMKVVAETSFTIPNSPVKNREDDTVVKPADMNMTGASACD